MGAAPLPRGAGQGRPDRVDEAGVRVGGHQAHGSGLGQAAGDQVPEERQPPGVGLGSGGVHPEDLPVPLGAHTGGDHDRDLDHPAVLADLHHQRVGGHERVRAGVQGPGAERGDLGVELLGHLRDLGLAQPGDPQGPDELVHPARADPEEVAGRDHRGQCRLRAAAAFHQPFREQRPFAQLGDRDVQGPHAGVEVAVAVAVAAVDPLGVPAPVLGAAHRVGLRREQRVDERG